MGSFRKGDTKMSKRCFDCKYGNFPPPGLIPGVPPGGGTCNKYGGFLNMFSKACSDFEEKSCYIATAVYGDYNAPQTLVLRKFRDETLSNSNLGRAFIKVYYLLSPPLAKWIGRINWISLLVKKVLDRVVERLDK